MKETVEAANRAGKESAEQVKKQQRQKTRRKPKR
jgi:hypothetical protein